MNQLPASRFQLPAGAASVILLEAGSRTLAAF
jgi:hypothetical protein